MHVSVRIPMHWSLDRAGDDLLLAVKFCSVVKDAVDDQRPVLHEAFHADWHPTPGSDGFPAKVRARQTCAGPVS